ncbi:MAG TPA: response regulator [Desulfuromonadales bacterium]|nr:response regulator [Desulfuromonadales bacterium]
MSGNADISVVLVDDNDIVRECVGAYLEDEGFTVFYAVDGEEALELVAQQLPTTCISDLRLPGMSGEAFIEQAFGISPVTAYLLHTGSDYLLSDTLRSLGMTPEDVFFKPIHELATLTDRIRARALRRGATV